MAPAGFGKTTLLAQMRDCLAEDGVRTAELLLRRADDCAGGFLRQLCLAVATLRDHETPNVADPFGGLLSISNQFVLLIDEVEHATDRDVQRLLRELLERLPRHGAVILAGRQAPELGLGRWRAGGQVLEFGPEELRFSVAEAERFFRLRGDRLGEEDLPAAWAWTEGWPAALSLLSLAVSRRGCGARWGQRLSLSRENITAYLLEEVLADQDTGMRRFLMHTSILRRLEPSICAALLPDIDCDAMLRAAQRTHVFVAPAPDRPGAWRHHRLFADVMREQLQREAPALLVQLHRAASDWFAEHGRPSPAIEHAIDADDTDRAVRLLSEHGLQLLQQGRMRALDRWLSALPPGALAREPLLQTVMVWSRCFTQGAQSAMQLLQALDFRDCDDPVVLASLRALLPVLLCMVERYAEGDAAGTEAIAWLPTGQPFFDSILLIVMGKLALVAGKPGDAHRFLADARRAAVDSQFSRMFNESVEGMLDLREGRLRAATARFRIAVNAGARAGELPHAAGNAWAGVLYSCAVYESGDIPAAERLLGVYLPMARQAGLADHMVLTHRMCARIALERGQVDTAFELLAELEYLGTTRRIRRVAANARLERARLLLLQGHGKASQRELDAIRDDDWSSHPYANGVAQEVDDLFIGQRRQDLHVGDPRRAAVLLKAELQRAPLADRRWRALKLRLLLALALHRAGDTAAATAEGFAVAQAAASEGFVRVVLDEGAVVRPLLRRLVEQVRHAAAPAVDPIQVAWLQTLLAQCGGGGDDAPDDSGVRPAALTELLTSKELQVLRLLADGYTNAAMATKLFVSENTVRTHLRHISAKLGARTRMQAVAIARRLALVD